MMDASLDRNDLLKLVYCPIFFGLSESEITDIFTKVRAFTRTFEVGDIAAFSNEPVNFLMIVLEGSVKGEMVDFSGKTIKIDDIPSPYPLATAFIFGKQNRFPVNVLANENTTLLYIPKYDLIKMLQSDMRILQNFLNAVSGHSQVLANKLKFLSFKTIKGKIAQYLLSLAGTDKDQVELPLTQHELAALFGVARPSLARALGEMAEEGIISVDRRQIHILDKNKLRQAGN
jgi:CRP-like cAMP-binding protein